MNGGSIVIENGIISLIPDTPASCNQNLHKEIDGVSLLGFLNHIIDVIVCIPIKANRPPEALAKAAFEKQMSLHTLYLILKRHYLQ